MMIPPASTSRSAAAQRDELFGFDPGASDGQAAEGGRHAGAIASPTSTHGSKRFARCRIRASAAWGIGHAAAGLHAVFGPLRDNGFGILTYHRVAERMPGIATPTWNVPPTQLRNQLAGLLSRGFEAWPLRKLIEITLASGNVPSRVFAVTFDDGYENNYTHAWPIVRELNVPATIFLATQFLDTQQPFPFDDWFEAGSKRVPSASWRPLSTEQCREMLASGLVDLGAHTHSHQWFLGRRDEFEHDLQACIDALRARFEVTNPTFAFPFGATSPELIDAARRLGVACGLSTQSQRASAREDAFHWGRFTVREDDSLGVLAAKLSGWYTASAIAVKAVVQPIDVVARLVSRRPRSYSTPTYSAAPRC